MLSVNDKEITAPLKCYNLLKYTLPCNPNKVQLELSSWRGHSSTSESLIMIT